LDPLKNENHKLVKENNDLHLAMIKVKEEAEYKDNRWKTTFKAIDGEKRDLKFVLE
jgi:centrosomal protein CEP135